MDDEGRRARPIKGSIKWGHTDILSEISLTRCVNVQPNRRHARADAFTLRQNVSGFGRECFCFSFLGVATSLTGGVGVRGVRGRFQGKNRGGGLGGEGVGAVGDSGGGLIWGTFNFLFFSLAVTWRAPFWRLIGGLDLGCRGLSRLGT